MYQRLTLAASLCALTLPAQITVITRNGSKAPVTWASIQKDAIKKGGLWVVLEDDKGSFAGALQAAQRTDSLIRFDLGTRSCGLKSPLGQEILARQGWEAVPRWVLLDAKGQVAAESTRKPTAETLVEALEKAGVRSRVDRLEAFVRANPDHGEALEVLLKLRLDLADRRMEALAIWKAVTGEPVETRELQRPLTDEEDQLIWGPVAETLETLVLRSDWQGSGVFWAGNLQGQPRISPLVQAAAARVLPEVELALRRHPTHWMTWHLWLKLSGWAGGRPLLPFLGTLVPAPGGDETFPPDNVVQAYVKEAKARKDWQAIRDLMLPHWERTREQEILFLSNEGEGSTHSAERTQWENSVEPLIEALLRLGDAGTADRVVQEALGMIHSKSIGTWAAQVATRCGQPSYAQRWAALTPPKGK